MTDTRQDPSFLDAFKRLEPIPAEGIARATAIMHSGRLFRYGGDHAEDSEVALLERDFTEYLGVHYALAVSSCTQAIELALIACGVKAGTRVLVPGFTFTAVPSAIVILGAVPVFVECTDDLRLDLKDLERCMGDDTPVLLLSHMRGHLSDLDVIRRLCAERGVTLIEDAAHALGAYWNGQAAGTFGRAGCFSFQSNKIINAGEGGVLVTDDEELFVRATYLSGAYENSYRKHFTQSALFERFAGQLPAHNVRMTNLTAAVARPQIPLVDVRGERYRAMYAELEHELCAAGRISFPCPYSQETRIPDSIQFRVHGCDDLQMGAFIGRVRAAGLPLSGFADHGNARAFYNWRYLGAAMPELPQTCAAIRNLCDMRLSSTLEPAHLDYIISSIGAALETVDRAEPRAVAQ